MKWVIGILVIVVFFVAWSLCVVAAKADEKMKELMKRRTDG